MGFFSWTCPHCDHSVLATAHEGINEWMREAVVLCPDGDVAEGTYDGYGHLAGFEISDAMEDGAVLVHLACWEVAGRPIFEFYKDTGLASKYAADQGFFFDDEHDMIDPRIKDAVERVRLLDEGRRARTKARFDQKARDAAEIISEARHGHAPGDAWQARFGVSAPQLGGKWLVSDRLGTNAVYDVESKEEAVSTAQRLWAQWIESDELKKLLARAEETRAEALSTAYLQYQEKGRYTVSYRPHKSGDTVKRPGERDWVGERSVHYVMDSILYTDVAVMDAPWLKLGSETFEVDPEYAGHISSAWEARVEAIRAASKESAALAKAEADRLNKEWAAAGYPVEGTFLDPKTPREV